MYFAGMASPSDKSKVYTYKDVYEHRKEGDIWVIHDGQVLDVSKFNNHPGGPEVLYEHAGLFLAQNFSFSLS